MGEFVDKVKGSANEVIGKVKQKSSDPETRQEGVAQKVKGKAQKLAGAVKGAMGDDI